MATISEISSLVGGTVSGNMDIIITSVATLEDAKPGDLSFVLEEKNSLAAESSHAVALIAPTGFTSNTKTVIQVKNPRLALAQILSEYFVAAPSAKGIDKNAVIGRNVEIGKNVTIYPFVFVGDNCKIGDNTVIHPHVTLYPKVEIGKNCIIHAGSVIGVDGFGFVPNAGKFEKIPQIGKVIIEDDVEIYANNSISRGTLGNTTIKSGTKMDNMNHIAHNVTIGHDCAITVFNAFGGSSSLGDRVQMTGNSALSPHIHVGEDSIIMAKTGVTKTVPPKSVLLGFPAQDHIKEQKMLALLRKLPELFDRVKKLEVK